MAALKASLLVLPAFALLLLEVVSAWSGSVTFYDNTAHDDSGGSYKYIIDDSQQCINLSCYNDRASSVKWKNLVNWGAFDDGARIAFYTGKDCTGKVRDWPMDPPNGYPDNFKTDGVDNEISSFMIWQFNKDKKGTALPCPWDFKCCLG
jgi:hypothetical protein